MPRVFRTGKGGDPESERAMGDDRLPALEMSLRDAWRVAWWGKWIILVTLGMVILGAVVHVHVNPRPYVATMVVAPASGTQLVAQAERTGLLLNSGTGFDEGTAQFERLWMIARSESLAKRLEGRRELIRPAQQQAWSADAGSGDALRLPATVRGILRAVARWIGLPGSTRPERATLAQYTSKMVLKSYKGTGLMEIVFAHPNPRFAVALLWGALEEADQVLRMRAKGRLQAQIGQLEDRIAAAAVVEHRQVLLDILGDRERRLLLIESSQPAFFVVIAPPTVSPVPAAPPLDLIRILVLAGGVSLGYLIALVLYGLKGPGAAARELGKGAAGTAPSEPV